MNPLELYLQSLYTNRISGSAVDETSGYGALQNLLNEIGKALKPRVRAIVGLKNQGAGMPDGGLFTPDQFQRKQKGQLIEGQLPSRGCIEVKPVSYDIDKLASTEQVLKYLNKYGQALLTNYNDFLLVGLDRDGKIVKRERFSLAPSESDFWNLASNPGPVSPDQRERFTEYLKRVMLHNAPLTQPKDVAWFLASYARDARIRIESSELPALKVVREALEEALGLQFEGEKGERFFRSTFVQTLFYGIFSAWVLWSKKNPQTKISAKFNWHEASWSLHVPMIKALFEQVATESKLKPLNLVEVLDWTGDVLNRVDRAAFFSNFEEAHAVQYFYEPFLQAFDPELRKELGVWYTPIEIVKYMVARVDTVLREELGITDGFANPRVFVLDPSCGTGAYLVEVLHKIHETLKEKGDDALAADDLKEAAMKRVFGFEILPAPFVVSHLQLGLVLQNLGAPLKESSDERVGVYLTNSLTGWELRDQAPLNWPELDEERKGSGLVKRKKPILVVLGNPPYNAFAGRSPKEEEGLVEDYKGVYFTDPPTKGKAKKGKAVKAKRIRHYRLSDSPAKGGWGIKKFNLDELYVRFFRLAERRIADKTGKGVVCFISNFSYLSDPSFVIMRERFLTEFDSLWLDSLNGDSRETGKQTPEGKPDPSVFSTEYNREGIRVGTAIGLFARKELRNPQPTIRYREFWGASKRTDLLKSLESGDIADDYQVVLPEKVSRLSFRPSEGSAVYRTWPRLTELLADPPINGLMEKRAGALIDINKDSLEKRIKKYYDPQETWESLESLGMGLTKDAARFNPKKARAKLLATEKYQGDHLRLYALRPFDSRWAYYTEVRPIWNEPRPSLWAQHWDGNGFLMSRPSAAASPEGVPFYFTNLLGDNDFLRGHAYYFPVRLKRDPQLKAKRRKAKEAVGQGTLGYETTGAQPSITANLSSIARSYLSALGIDEPDADELAGSAVWMHALAVGYSPAYLAENSDGIRQDWPRIPLPSTKDALFDSAELGKKVAALLGRETEVDSVIKGAINPALKLVGKISKVSGGALVPDKDLKVTAGWGHRGKGDATMPGKGKLVTRLYTGEETVALTEGAVTLGFDSPQISALLGENTHDIYLNDVAYWQNVPANVWDFTIGGYQVIKKWLSYREFDLLGRALTKEEAREVMNMARRIAAIILLQPELDDNYHAIKSATYSWPT